MRVFVFMFDFIGKTALMCAAEKGKREIFWFMFWRSNACIHSFYSYCIRFVALPGYEIVVQALIEKRANVNAVDQNLLTPLMYGIGEENIIKLLIENAADINAKNADNNSALIIAVKSGNHFENFLIVIKCFGADLNFEKIMAARIIMLIR